MAALAQEVVASLCAIEAFPVLEFGDRLSNFARNAPAVSTLKRDIRLRPEFGPPISTTSISGRDQSDALNRLAVQSVVVAITGLNSTADKSRFKECVKGVSTSRHCIGVVPGKDRPDSNL